MANEKWNLKASKELRALLHAEKYGVMNKESYELKALLYAEKYGIIEYKVKENIMVWYESFPNEGHFKHQLNLLTDKHLSIQLKRKPKN